MLTEKIPISFWMLVYAGIGSGIDYLRLKSLDRYVLCFWALTGLASGAVFHYAGLRFGDVIGFVSGFAATAFILLISKKFIKEHIISLDREPLSSVSEEDKNWYEDFKKEVDQEVADMQAAKAAKRESAKAQKHKKKK